MPRYAEVRHPQWIAAPVAVVQAQFADLEHHIRAGVHPKLRFELLEQRADGARYVQVVRLLGIRQRDVFERHVDTDGSIVDRSVEGFNRGATLSARFVPETIGGIAGTRVNLVVRLPLPPLVGGLLKPLLEAQILKALRAAAQEDRFDIEQRGYPARPQVGATPAAASPAVRERRAEAPVSRAAPALAPGRTGA